AERPLASAALSGVFIYLVLAGGWPFTVLMLIVATLVSWARAPNARRGALVLAAAWAVGAGLSAPAWSTFLAYGSETVRGGRWLSSLRWSWTVPPEALVGLVLPSFPASWRMFTEAGAPALRT